MDVIPQEPVKLVLAYHGKDFFGWACQPGLRTVQSELESVLTRLHGAQINVAVAGRTDRGVHALGQVVSYQGRCFSPQTLNALLPNDMVILSSQKEYPGFHARHSACSRQYRYRVWYSKTRSVWEEGRSLWWRWKLDVSKLHACAETLVGTHNFRAFTPTATDHARMERIVSLASWCQDGGLLQFSIEANSFVRHMNRVLVGTMLQVASGKRSVENFADLLKGVERSAAGPTISPQGLYLEKVNYTIPSNGSGSL